MPSRCWIVGVVRAKDVVALGGEGGAQEQAGALPVRVFYPEGKEGGDGGTRGLPSRAICVG